MRRRTLGLLVLALVFVWEVNSRIYGLDYGSGFFKLATIRGNSFDVVLNKQTKRKTRTAVAFIGEERVFGADTKRAFLRNPEQTYLYAGQLLGRSTNGSFVQRVSEHLTYSTAVQASSTGSLVLSVDPHNASSSDVYAPETLVAMVLEHVRELASDDSGGSSTMRDCVITVPPYVGAKGRKALLDAAHLAGLNVLSLVNDGLAVALHYSFGRKFSDEPVIVAFYDMGESATRASLVEFRASATKRAIPHIRVLASAWDEHLGGRDFTLRLAQHLYRVAEGQLGESSQLSARQRAKLYVSAEKAKQVLSANTETHIAVEDLVPGYDFRTVVTRDQFEDMCSDLLDRCALPLKQVLAEGPGDGGAAIELVGGGTRIPSVQAALRGILDPPHDELGRHLNGDEAMAFGAAFYAAHLSTTMRVGDMKVKDRNPWEVEAVVHMPQGYQGDDGAMDDTLPPRAIHDDDDDDGRVDPREDSVHAGDDALEQLVVVDHQGDGDASSQAHGAGEGLVKIRRVFPSGSSHGARKNMGFRTAKDNITIELRYPSGPCGPEELVSYHISGVHPLLNENFTGRPKVSLSFRLTPSGIPELYQAFATATPAPTKQIPHEEERVQNASLPSDDANGGDDENAIPGGGDTTDGGGDGDDENGIPGGGEGDENVIDESSKDENDPSVKQHGESPKESLSQQDTSKASTKTTAAKPRKKRIRLSIEQEPLGTPTLDSAGRSAARGTLQRLRREERLRVQLGEARNSLESFVYATKDALWEPDVEEHSTEDERETLREGLSDATDWLYDDGEHADLTEIRSKRAPLEKAFEAILHRIQEAQHRPEALEELREALNASRHTLLETNLTGRLNVEEDEIRSALELCDEVERWAANHTHLQSQLEKWEDPAFTAADVLRRAKRVRARARRLSLRSKRKPIVVDEATEDEELSSSHTGDGGNTSASSDEVPPSQETAENAAEDAPDVEEPSGSHDEAEQADDSIPTQHVHEQENEHAEL